MANRKKATEYWLSLMADLRKGNRNIKMYETYLNSLTDKEFADLMKKCADKLIILPYYATVIEDPDVEVADCIRVGKKLKINFLQRIIKTSPVTGVKRLTPKAFLILYLPVRRQAQHLVKGKSTAENLKNIDALSGQVIGISKTAKISQPELLNLAAQGLHHGIYELIGVRGGNMAGLKVAKRSLINEGSYSLEKIKQLGSRAESIETANTILRAMLYTSNL